MNLIKPNILNKGDCISIIAPSGPVDFDKIIKSKTYFENAGYKVKLGKHINNSKMFLAGDDEDRLEDLHSAFSDNEVKAIICARGGYGALRIINKTDYNLIASNPKIFCGYSDITVLSLMLLKKASLITFSSPMAQSDFAEDTINEETEQSFFNVLQGKEEHYIAKGVITSGKAKGIIWGGNLSSVVSLCGIDFIPDTDFILFLEDVSEPAYKIDKMLRQLLNIDKFKKNIKGIAYGEFSDTDNPVWVNDTLTEFAQILKIPASYGFKFTHGKAKQTIKIGGEGILDGNLTVK